MQMPVGASLNRADLESQLEDVDMKVQEASKALAAAKSETDKAFKALVKLDSPKKRDSQKFFDLRGSWQSAEEVEHRKYTLLYGLIMKQKLIVRDLDKLPSVAPVNPFIRKAAKKNPMIAKLLAQGKIG